MNVKKGKVRQKVIRKFICFLVCLFVFGTTGYAGDVENEENAEAVSNEITGDQPEESDEGSEGKSSESNIIEDAEEEIQQNTTGEIVQNNIQGRWYYNQKNKKWYYYNADNLMLKNCSADINGSTYFFNSDGEMCTGWIKKQEGWYYTESSGAMVKGWAYVGGNWYYLDGNNQNNPGLMVSNERRDINGSTYFFNASGEMRTGWIKKQEGWYYADSSGAMVKGWAYVGGNWYYLDGSNQSNPGLMIANEKRDITGHTYFFNSSGEMLTGWIKKPEGWYYAGASGAIITGWIYIEGNWYYLDGGNQTFPGLMIANQKKEISGRTYFFNSSGVMLTGWIKKPEGWYYTGASGAMAKGWIYTDRNWYYLDGSNQNNPGLMIANCEKEIGAVKYRFNSDGSMKTGWYRQNGQYYYYDISGKLASGWRFVDGKWYYMRPEDNVMECGGWKMINNKYYYLYNDGSMAQRWLRWSGNWYYLGLDGDMKTGWQQVGSDWYYMYKKNDIHGGEWGAMAKSTTIDGYIITSDGIWNTAFQNAYNTLNRIGWNLRAAYNWSAGLRYYRMASSPSQGSTYFANFGFSNGYGNCYVMAATFYHMAKLLGYDVHQVAGYCPLLRGGLTPHSWCEITINGTNYVFDPNFTNETGRNGYQITYGTSGTWRYTNYYRMN